MHAANEVQQHEGIDAGKPDGPDGRGSQRPRHILRSPHDAYQREHAEKFDEKNSGMDVVVRDDDDQFHQP